VCAHICRSALTDALHIGHYAWLVVGVGR